MSACDPSASAIQVPLQRINRAQFQQACAQLFPGLVATSTFPASGKGAVYSTSSEFNSVTSVEAEPILNAALEVGQYVADHVPSCSGAQATCAHEYLQLTATRAFRRAPTTSELTLLLQVFSEASSQPGMTYGEAVGVAVAALLQMPQFLYLLEDVPEAGAAELAADAIAQRMALVFTNGLPDDALVTAVARGPEARVAAARSLVSTANGQRMLRGFLLQWLGLEGFHAEGHDAGVQAALEAELALDVDAVIAAQDPVAELLASKTTQVNSVLQTFYGVDAGSRGPNDWRPVTLPEELRVGLLTHPLFLARLGHGVDPSYTKRGLFVRTMLLCEGIPPPPPNVMQSMLTGPNATPLEQSKARVADRGCGACHQRMDPIGYGFAAYDGLGRFDPTQAAVGTLDSSDPTLAGQFASVRALSTRLLQAPTTRWCFARQWLRYALGKSETSGERCAFENAARRLSDSGSLLDLVSRSAGEAAFVTRFAEVP